MKRKLLHFLAWTSILATIIPQEVQATIQRCKMQNTWAPVRRPEQLALTSWNSPVIVAAPEVPDPDPEGAGPVSVSLSDPVISDEFFDIVDLTITGLSLGQSVLLEKFLVDNDQGVLNSGAILQESHHLTDGVAAAAGETYNWNRLYDVTERDGQIQVQLDFWEPSTASMPGEYVYRVSSPVGSFTAQTVRLTIHAEPSNQHFIGTVTADGQPVSDAIVALLDPLTGYADFLKGTTTDSSGNYVLNAPYEDEFDIVALKPGHVGPLAVGTEWVIGSGETVIADLQLQVGTRTISGILEAADTGEPLAGIQLVFLSLDESHQIDNRLCTMTWTDSEGRYSARVTPDRWGTLVRSEVAAKAGFVTSSLLPLTVMDTRTADVTGTTTQLARATSVIWGEVLSTGLLDVNDDPLALGGIEIMAVNETSGKAAWTVTDSGGNYRLGVTPGRWRVFPFSFSLEESSHAGGVERELSVSGDHESLRHDFTVRPAGGNEAMDDFLFWLDDPDVISNGESSGGELWGYIQDGSANPIGRLRLLGLNTDLDVQEGSVQATYNSDGYYNFLLPEGEWVMFPDPEQSAARSLLFKDLPRVTITADDIIQRNVTVINSTSTIEFTILDSASAPLAGMVVHAFANIGGSTYDSFGVSDSEGVARMPAISGVWGLHVKAESTGSLGKKELPIVGVNVIGSTARVSVQAEDFTHVPPTLSLARRENGAFKFSGTGDSGRFYSIQASSDLKAWYEIGRVRAVSNAFNLVDESMGNSGRFYRVVQE